MGSSAASWCHTADAISVHKWDLWKARDHAAAMQQWAFCMDLAGQHIDAVLSRGPALHGGTPHASCSAAPGEQQGGLVAQVAVGLVADARDGHDGRQPHLLHLVVTAKDCSEMPSLAHGKRQVLVSHSGVLGGPQHSSSQGRGLEYVAVTTVVGLLYAVGEDQNNVLTAGG